MINLFNLARTTKNIKDAYDRNKSPYQKALQEEKHYERMENNAGYRNMMNTFATTKKTAENTFSAFSRATKPVNNVIENFSSFVPKKIDEGLFDDENIVYQNMRGNGYSDQKAKEVIYGRRKEMLGGQEYLTSNEQKLVKVMKNEGHNSDEIFGVLGLYRQEQEAKRQAEMQARIDEKNMYLSDARQGFMPGIDNDFQFHNTFGWLDDAGKFLQLKRENDDGFFESAGKMIANIPGNLLRTGAGIGNLASTAVQEGIYDTAAGGINQMGKMGAEYINNVGEVYNEAKNRKGIGQGIMNATNKVLEGATNFVVDSPLDAMTIMKPKDVGTIYKGATKATIETGKIITKPVHPLFEGTKNIIKKYAGSPDEIAGIQAAIRPRVTRKGNIITRSQEQIHNDIRLANGLIRASGEKPIDLASYKAAVKNEMQKIGDEINRLTGQDLEVDLSATIGKLEDLANSKTTQMLDGGDGNKIAALVDNLKASKGKISVADAEDMNQWLNDTLKSPVSSASETTKRGYQILVADIRDALDNSISQIPGEFKEIKKAYGSLRNIYGDIIKREIVYNRQNPTGLVESVGAIAGAGDVVGGMGKIITGSPKEGFSQIGKGITSNAVGRFITHKNDPNTIIKNIFAKDVGGKVELPNIGVKDASNGVKFLNNTTLPNQKISLNKGIEQIKNNSIKTGTVLNLEIPNKILGKIFGKNDFPLTQKTLKDKIHKHGLTLDDIKNLDKEAINPIAIYEGGSNAKSAIIITNKSKGVEKIAIAIAMERNGKPAVNSVASIHPKNLYRYIKEKGDGKAYTVHFEDTKKLQLWKELSSSQRGAVTTNNGSNAIIPKNLKKSNNSAKLSYTHRNLEAPIISQAEAKAIVRKYFSDDQVSVKLADRIVANDGVEALGMYHKKMIAFAKNPTKYTPEHEVFHAYFDMALKSKEKNAILKTIMKEQNFAKKIDAEEFMADAFAEFVVGRREVTGLAGKMAKIFDDLSYMFKKFFGQEDKVERLYRELESIGKGQSHLTSHNNILSSKKKYFIDHTGKNAEDIVVPRKKKNETLKEGWTRRDLEKNKAIKKYGGEHIDGVEFDKMPKAYKDVYNSYKSFINSIEYAKSEGIKGVDIMGNTKILNIVKKLGIKASEQKEWNGFGYKTIGRTIDMKDALKIAKKMRTELDEASNKYTAKIIKQGGKSAEDITIERYRNEYREHPQETIADTLYNLNKEAKKIRDQRTKLKGKIYGDDEGYAASYSDWQRKNAHEKLQDLFDEMEGLYNLKDATIEKMIQKFDLKPKGYHEFSNGSQMDYYEFGGRGFHVDRNIATNSLGEISEQISSKKVGKKMSLDVVKKVLAFLDDETLNASLKN